MPQNHPLGDAFEQLVLALRALPGIGPRSAQRLALELLDRRREGARLLAESLQQALQQIRRCECCRNLSDRPRCRICSDERRNRRLLCVVESAMDVLAIEQTGAFAGLYHVLHGRLSPIDGVGPEALGIPQLEARLEEDSIEELILATGATVEGEATAEFIAQACRVRQVAVSRPARGIPLGGELGFLDRQTLGHALTGRDRF